MTYLSFIPQTLNTSQLNLEFKPPKPSSPKP